MKSAIRFPKYRGERNKSQLKSGCCLQSTTVSFLDLPGGPGLFIRVKRELAFQVLSRFYCGGVCIFRSNTKLSLSCLFQSLENTFSSSGMEISDDSVIRMGYFIKSPPAVDGIKGKAKRWYRRWFVLCRTYATSEDESTRTVLLYYFENRKAFRNRKEPKGRLIIYF